MSDVQRVASVIRVKPESIAEYEELHANVWPEVLEIISACSIRNYSIFRYGELLFSYFEYVGSDLEADYRKMAEDPHTQRWWSVCDPMQAQVSEAIPGEWWHEIPQVFHHD